MLIVVFILALFLGGCQKEEEVKTIGASLSEGNMIVYKDIIEYSGNGVNVNNQKVTITNGGSYYISGTSQDGQLIVDARDQEVQLILDNLELTCSSSAPIYIMNAKKVTITLNDETTNTISDGKTYSDSDEPSATIFSKDDLVLNGSGQLIVNANYNDAIQSKDTLLIESGNYMIHSVDDGIIGKDSLTIQNGSFEMNTNGDAFKTTNDTDSTLGNILIENGTYMIHTQADGFQSINQLTINNGTFTINTTSLNMLESTKGIKATQDLTINNGNFNIQSVDDCLHANGNLVISEGTFVLNTQDDGMHSDAVLTIQNGNIDIQTSYEGLEGNEVEINGGTIMITSSDDGINAAGGNDQSNNNGRFGGDPFSNNGNSKITFNDGMITVNANGDGIDANGSIYINGGTIYVNGSTDQANNALDYDSQCVISKGTLLALGQASMLQGTSTNSTQYSFTVGLNTSYKAGTKIVVKDSQGNSILSYTALKSFQSVVFSHDQLKQGESYTIELDGKDVTTITLTSIVTTSGNASNLRGMEQPNRGW